MKVSFRFQDLVKWSKGLKKFIPGYSRMIKQTLDEIGREAINSVIRTSLSGAPGLNTRTGKLRSSLYYEVINQEQDHRVLVKSTSPYFAMHLYGGTIRPVKAQALAIPLGPVYEAIYESPLRRYANLEAIYPAGTGRAFLVDTNTGHMTHVLIRGSFYVRPRINSERIQKDLQESLSKKLATRSVKILVSAMNRG